MGAPYTYREFVFLAALNAWPGQGLPADDLLSFAAGISEGDPRGAVTREQMLVEYGKAFTIGWALTAHTKEDQTFVYPTAEGRRAFAAAKAQWAAHPNRLVAPPKGD